MRHQFQCLQGSFAFSDIAQVAKLAGVDIHTLPFVRRVLLENLCRHQAWGKPVSDAEINGLLSASTPKNRPSTDLPLHVSRVILPDSSGLPVLQDLAALRDAVARAGGNAAAVATCVPVDLIVDHSLQVDHWGSHAALGHNLRREFERNNERYRFFKWAQQAFQGLRVYPPGTGIIHQVNLEHIAPVVSTAQRADGAWAFPDFVMGADSHTPMVNALGVLGWGVGGLDAEAALLGHAYTFPLPRVIGVRLIGKIRPPAMTTDAALLITQTLRNLGAAGVAGCMVEFFGPAVASLAVAERATIANMAPEYGATCGFFPVDAQTLIYLHHTGRGHKHIDLVASYCHANHLFRAADSNATVSSQANGLAQASPLYDQVIEIDLSQACPSLAGPRRPQDRMALAAVAADFNQRLVQPLSQGGFAAQHPKSPSAQTLTAAGNVPKPAYQPAKLQHGAVVLAAITSCTNTSNPAVMLAAGLIARNAVARGIAPAAWVKTSFAPGSRTVTEYLAQAGLLPALEALGFHVIGYGCTTCGGKSGPLAPEVVQAIETDHIVTAAVLSGNRNFEGRIHKLIQANYIGSPPLVVLYALAGRIDIDFATEAIAFDPQGHAVYLHDLWPSDQAITALMPHAHNPQLFRQTYQTEAAGAAAWQALEAPTGLHFPWDAQSHYLCEPPFFQTLPPPNALTHLAQALQNTAVLAAFGDSLTTDHISPGGEIPQESPSGHYLSQAGIAAHDFNSYVARRCNHAVMVRGTFANIRIKNLLLPEREGGITPHFPEGTPMSIFEAATRYQQEGRATIVLAGQEYGTGSSRDWAAKGTALLGVRAVLAESFERIHRANLVGMGVLPLQFSAGEGWRQLGLTGNEQFTFHHVEAGIRTGAAISVSATGQQGCITFQVMPQVLTEAERELMQAGGLPASVLRSFLPASAALDLHQTPT